MSKLPHRAYLGLGSNLGDGCAKLQDAVDAIDASGDIRVTSRSGLYRTRPWGDPDQPDFINAVLEVHCRMEPHELMERLLDIERRLGRERDARRWGPRVLDIDLLLFDDLTLNEKHLTLPHPRMHLRAFVLAPLLELAPDCEIPGHGSAAGCWELCDDQGVTRLDIGWPRAVSSGFEPATF